MEPHQPETARERLARLMDERREELGLLWNQVADRAGLTKTGLAHVRFENRKMRAPTKRGIEEALQWAPGSVDAILAGGLPQPEIDLDYRPTSPGQAAANSGPPGDRGVDLVYHAPDGGEVLIQVKQYKGDPKQAAALAKAIREYAANEGGTVLIGEEEPPTIREVLDDPNLPDEVKRYLLAAYDMLRNAAAAAALQRRPTSDKTSSHLGKTSKG